MLNVSSLYFAAGLIKKLLKIPDIFETHPETDKKSFRVFILNQTYFYFRLNQNKNTNNFGINYVSKIVSRREVLFSYF